MEDLAKEFEPSTVTIRKWVNVLQTDRGTDFGRSEKLYSLFDVIERVQSATTPLRAAPTISTSMSNERTQLAAQGVNTICLRNRLTFSPR